MGQRARLAVLAALVLAAFLVARRLYELLYAALGGGSLALLAVPLYVGVAALIAWAAAARTGRRPQSAWPPNGQVAAGFLLGAGIVLATLLVELAAGWAHVSGLHVSARALAGDLWILTGVAAAEELVFRLSLFAILAALTSWRAGAVLSSLAFAAVHIGVAPGPVYLASLTVFGLLACRLYLARGSLWLPIGAHAGWDFASAAAFQTFGVTLNGPVWLAGLPGHLSAGLVMLAVLLAVWIPLESRTIDRQSAI
jgi:membrane protease YdiL (CAAX protease family)